MSRPTIKIDRGQEAIMLTMLVAGMRANPHKHKQAIGSSDIVTEANQDLQAIMERCKIEVREPLPYETD